jgi:hypothetical protein
MLVVQTTNLTTNPILHQQAFARAQHSSKDSDSNHQNMPKSIMANGDNNALQNRGQQASDRQIG